MRIIRAGAPIFLWVSLLFFPPASGQAGEISKFSSSLQRMLQEKSPQEKIKVWVFFGDRGPHTRPSLAAALERTRLGLSERSLQRRRRAHPAGDVVDYSDLPVYQPYVTSVEGLGARVLTRTRWLNGVSAQVSVERVGALAELPFVREIRPVKTYVRREERLPLAPPVPSVRRAPTPAPQGDYDYGDSYFQASLLNVPALHRLGYTGSGVRLAILDSGFDLSHRALRHLTGRIVAEWDFVNNDGYTGFDANQDFLRQPEHGTKMLSLIAGFQQTQLVGPAFGAEFVLAKTEQVYDTTGRLVEIPQEEQNWVAGLEWADSLGADIVSSSLGYRDFDPGYPDYSNSEMNGHTAVTSVAASMAANKGMLVVNAVGNVLESAPRDTSLSAPADADSIIAVGGVGFDSTWIGPSYQYSSYFSACGPTADGRTKPELVGAWQAWAVSYPSTDSFSYISGTSCATATIAGSCALMLEVHPDWTPMAIRDSLLSSGSFHLTPNDSVGWGVPDFYRAAHLSAASPPTQDQLLSPYPNPFLPEGQQSVRLPFHLAYQTDVNLLIFSIAGELVRTIPRGILNPGRYVNTGPSDAYRAASWDGKNDAGKKVGSGIYICLLSTGYGSSRQKIAVVR